MADFTGRIRRIRIRENQNDTSFRTVVVVVGDTNQEVKFVEVKFDNPEQVPAPTPTVMVPTQTSYNPEKEVSRFVYKPLTFANGAKPIETKYTMTAQMKPAEMMVVEEIQRQPLQAVFIEFVSGRTKMILLLELLSSLQMILWPNK